MIATLRKAATAFSIILATLGAGCARTEYRCRPSSEFTAQDVDDLIVASEVWRGKAYVDVIIDPDGDDVEILRADISWLTDTTNESLARAGKPLLPKNDVVTGAFAYDHGDRRIFIEYGAEGYNLITIAAHEMGHLLGNPHLPEGQTGLMASSAGPPYVDENTLANCRRVRMCP